MNTIPRCLRPYPKVGPGNNWSCDAYQIRPTLFVCLEDDSSNWSVIYRDVNEDIEGQEIGMFPSAQEALAFACLCVTLET